MLINQRLSGQLCISAWGFSRGLLRAAAQVSTTTQHGICAGKPAHSRSRTGFRRKPRRFGQRLLGGCCDRRLSLAALAVKPGLAAPVASSGWFRRFLPTAGSAVCSGPAVPSRRGAEPCPAAGLAAGCRCQHPGWWLRSEKRRVSPRSSEASTHREGFGFASGTLVHAATCRVGARRTHLTHQKCPVGPRVPSLRKHLPSSWVSKRKIRKGRSGKEDEERKIRKGRSERHRRCVLAGERRCCSRGAMLWLSPTRTERRCYF